MTQFLREQKFIFKVNIQGLSDITLDSFQKILTWKHAEATRVFGECVWLKLKDIKWRHNRHLPINSHKEK